MTDIFEGVAALWLLFATGFLSATLLPGGSEATLVATLGMGDHPVWLIVLAATAGNTLGGMTNYVIGRILPASRSRGKQIDRALVWLRTHGYWALLLSWLPVIGDPLCLAAGWLRMGAWRAVCMIFIGKALRYALLAAVVSGLSGL